MAVSAPGLSAGSALTRLRAGWRGVAWYVKEVLGENDYAHYVDHLSRHHPGAKPITRRQFERDKMDRLQANPKSRCC